MKFWELSENKCIFPPTFKRQPRRPKNKRHREGDENEFKLSKRGQKSVKCSVCKASGHNKGRCPTTHPPPATRKGRKSKKNKEAPQPSSQPTQASQTTSKSTARGQKRRRNFP
ncbi:hypothetical protein ACFX2J_013930 [Malus domestica]